MEVRIDTKKHRSADKTSPARSSALASDVQPSCRKSPQPKAPALSDAGTTRENRKRRSSNEFRGPGIEFEGKR